MNVLGAYFEAFGRPPLIVLMHYANDVDDDEDAVIRGAVGEADPRWTTSLSYLDRIADAARVHGASLLIAAVPPARQFATPDSRRHYQDVLRRFCELRGIRFLDLFDSINRSGPGLAYFQDDPHWTPAGHRVVAETLFSATRDMLVR